MDPKGADETSLIDGLNAVRLRVLADTSRAFASVATDFQQLVETIARTTADLIGDGCQVTLIASDGETLYNAASAHRDPDLEADYRAFLAMTGVAKTTSKSVSAAVARTGEPRLLTEVRPEQLVEQTDDTLKPIVARLRVHSFVVVPIRARETILGTLSLMRSRPDHSYTADDMVMLLDLADRAGLAIENARLYRDLERRVQERTAALEAVNDDLEAFGMSVAHDLRAPIRRIDGFAKILADEHASHLDSDARRYLEIVRAAAQHMGQLVDALLSLSRVSRSEIRQRPVDLSQLAISVVARLRDLDPERRVHVVIEDALIANADPRLVDVVLTNLIGNAWKFTRKRESAHIEIGRLETGGPKAFFVRDDGIGFDPAATERLFEVFHRLHDGREFEGLGIGLVTVQRIVRRHGGRVWAESEPDRGATFCFTLSADSDVVT